ncbi:hypothetical protein T265_07890 [Opisthorchis viverrini]|uniref:Uncharacterized protein n=1 Tax=Opisthorchis viverrini TaxID=6198 RepID=A0A075AA67_OPIVI|nr:hypothetical protein T265_07890 [Opisthorchis viverrini]KER24464.1 hypothetical protein T265_07890 [Opisthorchis viverrini]
MDIPCSIVRSSDKGRLYTRRELSEPATLLNKSWLYGSEASVLNTDTMLSMMGLAVIMGDLLEFLGTSFRDVVEQQVIEFL